MELNEATIATFRMLIFEPEKQGLPFPTLKECFKPATVARANDLLYADYMILIENRPLPKVIFYILMREAFGDPNGKDKDGSLGYRLRVAK